MVPAQRPGILSQHKSADLSLVTTWFTLLFILLRLLLSCCTMTKSVQCDIKCRLLPTGSNCAGCHKLYGYDTAGNIDLASWTPAPPPVVTRNGETVYNDNCAACHTGAAHNGQIDQGFETAWNAKSGTATGNSNGTCSNISCHGGKTTPNWVNGSINVDTQCSSCHSYGTSQYNGYSSGEHNKHVRDKGYACSACHDSAKLRNGHFTNLETRAFEQEPSATIKSSLSYSGGRCATPSCHGGERW